MGVYIYYEKKSKKMLDVKLSYQENSKLLASLEEASLSAKQI